MDPAAGRVGVPGPEPEHEPPPEPDRRLSRAVLVPWTAAGAVSTLAAAIVAAVVAGALDRAGSLPEALRILLPAAVAAYGMASVLVFPALRYRTWRYAVREDEIDLVHGAVVRTRTIVPMARVQHVDTQQSPLGRLLGIATLHVHTAAARHEVPGLEARVASTLRTEIARRAMVPDEV